MYPIYQPPFEISCQQSETTLLGQFGVLLQESIITSSSQNHMIFSREIQIKEISREFHLKLVSGEIHTRRFCLCVHA